MTLGMWMICLGAVGCGLVLSVAARLLKVEGAVDASRIEALMPGMQCGQCGFPGCHQASVALVEGKATVTLCPPGGRSLVEALAQELGVPVPGSGAGSDPLPLVAHIGEALCIGCTKCSKACPTDAIVGASKQIHAVMPQYCTACRKCVDACPTETIQLTTPDQDIETWTWPAPNTTRAA